MSQHEPEDELSDVVTCPTCNGSGEVKRPTCSFGGCGQKMIRQINGDGWECPIHNTILL